MGGGVLDAGLDESASSTLAEWAPCEIGRQLEIEVIHAVAIGFSSGRGRFEDGNVHAAGFDGDVGLVDRLAAEVVGPDRTSKGVSGTEIGVWVFALFGALHDVHRLRADL